jgi:hypothetical protein
VALNAPVSLDCIRNFGSTLQSLPDACDRIADLCLKSPEKKKLLQREALRRASNKFINQEMQYEQRE